MPSIVPSVHDLKEFASVTKIGGAVFLEKAAKVLVSRGRSDATSLEVGNAHLFRFNDVGDVLGVGHVVRLAEFL